MKKRLFVLGDSISIQYGPYLKKMTGHVFLYDRKRGMAQALHDLDTPVGANGGDSRNVLEFLTSEDTRQKLMYDIILLNCGLHDIKTDPGTGRIQVPMEEYRENLTHIFKLVKSAGVFPVWVNTTPVEDGRHNTINRSFFRYNRDVLEYNEKALGVARCLHIPVIDLYSFVSSLEGDIYCDHVHFVEDVRKLQAAFIAGNILML